ELTTVVTRHQGYALKPAGQCRLRRALRSCRFQIPLVTTLKRLGEMVDNRAENLFTPFSFEARTVSTASETFDFHRWKEEPSEPIILKGTLADWPLFQNLSNCRTVDEPLDYLSSTFGNNLVRYTRIPGHDPFMGYDDNGTQNFKYAPTNCKLNEFCALMRTALKDPQSDVLYARGGANSV